MFKKIIKMILFVFVIFVFCGSSGQIAYARKGGNKPNIQIKQKNTTENSKLPSKWRPNSELQEFNEDGRLKKYENMVRMEEQYKI